MKKVILTYYHTRNLFSKNKFKPFVKKYFEDVKFLGTESGNYSPAISVSLTSFEKNKFKLPKYAIPEKIKWDEGTEFDFFEALLYGQFDIARVSVGRIYNTAQKW